MRTADAAGIGATSSAGLATALIVDTPADAVRLSLVARGSSMDRAATNISILAMAGRHTVGGAVNLEGPEFLRTKRSDGRRRASEKCPHPVTAEEDSGTRSMRLAGPAMGGATPLGRGWRLQIRRAEWARRRATDAGTALTAVDLKVTAARWEDSKNRAGSTCLIVGTARIVMAAGMLRMGSLAAAARPRNSGAVDLVGERCPKCRHSAALAGTSVEATRAMDILGIPAEVIRVVTGARVITKGQHSLIDGGILAV